MDDLNRAAKPAPRRPWVVGKRAGRRAVTSRTHLSPALTAVARRRTQHCGDGAQRNRDTHGGRRRRGPRHSRGSHRRRGCDRSIRDERCGCVGSASDPGANAGITWAIVRGDDVVKVQRRAGHRLIATTMRYIVEAENAGAAFGVPFPPLPASLVGAHGEIVETGCRVGVLR